MKTGDILLLRGKEIEEIFAGRELDMMEAVHSAYLLHDTGDVSLPNCPFLRIPGDESSRIIAKPAYLGGTFQTAGIKWIASFPRNGRSGMARASATLVLNSVENGVPTALMEGSIISALRTGASAALAADVLRGDEPATVCGVIGCGLINFTVLRFLLVARPEIEEVLLYDTDSGRAEQFARKIAGMLGGRGVRVVGRTEDVIAQANVVSLATTATVPHLRELAPADRNAVVLHVSLRDFTPDVVAGADNVVDDLEHICSNATSVHLAEQATGGRSFIRTTLGRILAGTDPARVEGRPVLFSPFGMGVLDMALGHLAFTMARDEGRGTVVADFLPAAWDSV